MNESVGTYLLRLYIAGNTPNSRKAIKNLQHLAEVELRGECRVEVVDLLRDPLRASEDDIIATPTLVKREPPPTARLIGNIGEAQRVLEILGIRRK